MIFFTSDLHFNHKNIIEYEKSSRNFSSLEEMNEKLIENWNSVVAEDDTVYILGDFFMGPLDPIDEIMPRLKGKKILIRGNHDTNPRVARLEPYCEGMYDLYNLKYKNKFFVLCHFPLREWMHKEHGSIHLYGHVHSNEHRNGFLSEPNSYHIGTDTNNLTPVSIDFLMDKFSPCTHSRVNSETSKIDGHIDYYVCADCGKIVNEYNINNMEVYV